MKNLILILAITLSMSACKKEKLQNCMIGEWKKTEAGNTTYLTISEDYFTYKYSNGNTNSSKYSINKNGLVVFNFNPATACLKVTCNSNELKITGAYCDSGEADPLSGINTYTKK